MSAGEPFCFRNLRNIYFRSPSPVLGLRQRIEIPMIIDSILRVVMDVVKLDTAYDLIGRQQASLIVWYLQQLAQCRRKLRLERWLFA